MMITHKELKEILFKHANDATNISEYDRIYNVHHKILAKGFVEIYKKVFGTSEVLPEHDPSKYDK